MKKLVLKQLEIENFKGCSSRTDQYGIVTNIFGANATGKTTIADAIFWLLFDKDSQGNTKFQVRPLDAYNQPIHKIDITVAGTFDIDGRTVVLKKTQRENWVKTRGTQDQTFKGNENLFEINGTPKSQAEYKAFISNIVEEEVFKLITNPQAFVNKPWKEQRDVLLKLVTEITDLDVIAQHERFRELEYDLEYDSIEDLTARSKKAISEWNKRNIELPARIDEAHKMLVNIDLAELELQKNALNEQIAAIETEEEDYSKQYEKFTAISNKLMETKFKMSDIARKANEALQKKRSDSYYIVSKAKTEYEVCVKKKSEYESELNHNKIIVDALTKEKIDLLSEYEKVKTMQFDGSLSCPYCGQGLPEGKKEEILTNFEKKRKSQLEGIVDQGKRKAAEIERLILRIAELGIKINDVVIDIDDKAREYEHLKTESELLPTEIDMSDHEDYLQLAKVLADLEEELHTMDNGAEYRTQLKIRKNGLSEELRSVERKIASADNTAAERRIEQLEEEQKTIGQKIANEERKLFLYEEFTKEKMNLISSNINSLFKVVSFKLFDNQINGGYSQTCECMVKGVPYSSLNSAAKVQAGLDIINSLQKFYDVSAPIMLDNRESVTDIPYMDCQIINFFVSPIDAELRVVVE